MKFKYFKIVLSASFIVLAIGSFATAQTVKDTSVIKEAKIINIPFGKQLAKHLTSSISTAYGSDLQKTFTTTIGNTLYGRIAGLTVTQGGNEPGINSAGLNGRGNNTFGTGNDLLVIIDGYPGDLTQLVVDEIDQISLLKDASATAIYGGRGANGVILVTTKRGTISPLKINFSTQQGISQAIALPKYFDSYNYATLYNEALANDGLAPKYTAADLTAYQDGSDPYFHPNVNWYDAVLKPSATVANYNINFKGGNSTAKYFVLLNAITSGGLYKNFGDFDEESSNSKYTRYNFRTNIDVNLTKRLSANLLFGGTIEDKANPSSLYSGGTFDLISKIPPNAFPIYNPDGTFSRNSTYSNPYANLLKTGYATSNGRTLQSSFKLNYDLSFITEGLSVSAAASLNNYFASGSNFTKTLLTRILSKGILGDTVYNNNGQTTSLSQASINYGQYRNFAIQAFVNYHRVFGKHNITALGMFNSDNSTVDKSSIYTTTSSANLSLPYKSNAGAARLTYVYNDKYIAEVSGSYMGTENFAPGKRYGLFPAASLGWIVSNESFLKNNKALSFFKLRGSYGIVGNVDIGGTRFLYEQLYPYTAAYYLGTSASPAFSIAEGRRASPDATWEKENKLNIGFDATLFKNWDISLDVFNQDRSNILVTANATTPAYLGFTDIPYQNLGKVNNKGFEFVLRYHSTDKKSFKYFVEANVFYAKNKRVFDAQPIQINQALITQGSRLGQPYGLKALGLFQTDADVVASAKPIGIKVRTGDVKYEDIGGPLGVPDGIIDANDNQPIGNTGLPELTVGLHTGLQYKGFDLDLVFQAVSGNTVYFGSNQFRPFQGFGQVGVSAVDRWTPATSTTAVFPRLSSTDNLNNYRFSSLWQRDGSFVKLRSAEIGYSLPAKLI
ncbi:MAG: SusC/RagA family TonB-linked outer membrane protein, partial [Deinococcales bacterium]|nr:SusC/RagA family TonB-linked outer membrane protein [Chitinophagaceae bacterium]